jgi:hypothetical protein
MTNDELALRYHELECKRLMFREKSWFDSLTIDELEQMNHINNEMEAVLKQVNTEPIFRCYEVEKSEKRNTASKTRIRNRDRGISSISGTSRAERRSKGKKYSKGRATPYDNFKTDFNSLRQQAQSGSKRRLLSHRG